MQESFGFVAPEVEAWRRRLGPVVLLRRRRSPVGQLIKSSISARTRDAVSLAAYHELGKRFGSAAGIARADPAAVERAIAAVTFADAKARHLVAALRQIAAEDGGFALTHLAQRPLDDALAWLERLPGVGRKVSASTLNASTLGRPVMIVDTHVLRVLQRLGSVGAGADYRAASEAVAGAMTGWTGDDFLGFHIALKHLGQQMCRRDDPACDTCPLLVDCHRYACAACPLVAVVPEARCDYRGGMDETADVIIARLGLAPHPEGGWYRETWRATAPHGTRPASTAILFLLKTGERSHWHRVDADEHWIWNAGDPLALRIATDERGPVIEAMLDDTNPQAVVPVGQWQAAEPVAGAAGYALVSCVVAPGFDFAGFELAPEGWAPHA